MKLKKLGIKKKASSSNFDANDYNEDMFENEDEKGLPIQRNSANARERARMRVLSSAFYRLKTIIPWVPHDTKLSKLDTLRLARNYIAYLSATLDGQQVQDMSNKIPQPQKMTWPYIFQVPEFSDLNLNKNTEMFSSRSCNINKEPPHIGSAEEFKNYDIFKCLNSNNEKCKSDSDIMYD